MFVETKSPPPVKETGGKSGRERRAELPAPSSTLRKGKPALKGSKPNSNAASCYGYAVWGREGRPRSLKMQAAGLVSPVHFRLCFPIRRPTLAVQRRRPCWWSGRIPAFEVRPPTGVCLRRQGHEPVTQAVSLTSFPISFAFRRIPAGSRLPGDAGPHPCLARSSSRNARSTLAFRHMGFGMLPRQAVPGWIVQAAEAKAVRPIPRRALIHGTHSKLFGQITQSRI